MGGLSFDGVGILDMVAHKQKLCIDGYCTVICGLSVAVSTNGVCRTNVTDARDAQASFFGAYRTAPTIIGRLVDL